MNCINSRYYSIHSFPIFYIILFCICFLYQERMISSFRPTSLFSQQKLSKLFLLRRTSNGIKSLSSTTNTPPSSSFLRQNESTIDQTLFVATKSNFEPLGLHLDLIEGLAAKSKNAILSYPTQYILLS